MCDYCSTQLVSRKLRPHLKENCSLAKLAYCSTCGTTGHFTMHCTWVSRSSEVRTVKATKRIPALVKPRITLVKTAKAIRAFLYQYQQSVYQDLAPNMTAAKKFCASLPDPYEVRFVEPPADWDECEEGAECKACRACLQDFTLPK